MYLFVCSCTLYVFMLYVIEGMERWRKRESGERERGGWMREWKDRDACNFSEVVTVTNSADSMYVVYLCPITRLHTPH